VVRPFFHAEWAVLQDLSASGVGLLVDRAPEPGAVILLQLPARTPEGVHTRRARVAHVTGHPGGDYLVGCRFSTPLTAEELVSVRKRLFLSGGPRRAG
jgi:hypothetical protein